MTAVIVDTNVAIVAEGNSDEADEDCVESCIQALGKVRQGRTVVLDEEGHILREYRSHLNVPEHPPGPGVAFYRHVLERFGDPIWVQRVPTHGTSVPKELQNLDKDDHKWVLACVAHPARPEILQALDSKWWALRSAFTQANVTVDFLCPKAIQALANRKESRKKRAGRSKKR